MEKPSDSARVPNFYQTKVTYLLNNELGDSVPDFDGKICFREVGKNNANLTTVVGVDYAGHGVDAMLSGET
jgi:hypothetical protein